MLPRSLKMAVRDFQCYANPVSLLLHSTFKKDLWDILFSILAREDAVGMKQSAGHKAEARNTMGVSVVGVYGVRVYGGTGDVCGVFKAVLFLKDLQED